MRKHYDVELLAVVPRSCRVAAVIYIRKIKPMRLKMARDLVFGDAKLIGLSVRKIKAQSYVADLSAIGAVARVVPVHLTSMV